MGIHNGVAAKLKQMCPSIVPIWCVAHRLELSALDSITSVPLLAELKETLNGVYKHYSHSAKASRELHALGKVVGINVVKPGAAQLSLLFQRDGLTLQMVSDGLQTTTLSLVAMQLFHPGVQSAALANGSRRADTYYHLMEGEEIRGEWRDTAELKERL
ncbi:hypothetical protein KUCAC02_000026, partial [Chaenocephalus aceratus]